MFERSHDSVLQNYFIYAFFNMYKAKTQLKSILYQAQITVFTRFVARALIFFNLTHCRAPIQTGVYLSTGACYFQSKITTKIIVEDKYFTTFNLSPYESRNHGSRNQYYLLRNQCYLLCNWTSKALVLSAKT